MTAIAFMTDHCRIVRIDAFPGAGPPHYTGPQGHYLYLCVFDEREQARRSFETSGKTVENYRVGRALAVEYVEGCL
jgi:hypothetical protein